MASSAFASIDRDAAQKAFTFLDMLASLDQVHADPACRSLLREIADDNSIGHKARDTHDESVTIHVERVLAFFRASKPPKTRKKAHPCGQCSISKVKVCCILADMSET